MKKRLWLSLFVIGFISFGFLFNYVNNSKVEVPEPTTKPVQTAPVTTAKPVGEVENDTKFVTDVLSPFVINNNYGQLYESYAFSKTDYLVETQFAGGIYDSEFTSNIILMAHIKDGKLTMQQLTSSSYLVHLFKENGNPFLTISKNDNSKLVIFYEVSARNHYPLSGQVYKVEKNGSLSLAYQTKGVFSSMVRSTSGDLTLTEKEYDDNKNKYPTAFKPYYLHHLSFQNGTFKEISKERIDPNEKK